MMEESRPPLKKTPTGTSATSLFLTDSSSKLAIISDHSFSVLE